MKDSELLIRLEFLIAQARTALSNHIKADSFTNARVKQGDYAGFKSASLSFISSLYGVDHTYYTQFERAVRDTYIDMISSGISILGAIKNEIENGWITSLRQLVAAEVFADFLEMSEHLLEEGYKDAAAVMIGSVLEEHLRQLCSTYKVDTHTLKGTDKVPKQASLINDDLKKAGAYGPIQVKQVTAWLAIRNSAAHGKYTEYSIEQVTLMYAGIVNFIATIN